MVGARTPRDIPPVWLSLAIAVMVALHHWLPIATWLPAPWSRAGYAVIAASVLLMLACVWRFRRHRTNLVPFRPASHLVVDGAFRFSRNPMYLGLLGVALGTAMCFGTASSLAVLPGLFWVLDQRFVSREEVLLRQQFGLAYDDYTDRVRRWL